MNYLSIDVGGTFIKFGIIDRAGTIVEEWKSKTPSDLETFKEVLAHEIKSREATVKGIGMSCPGKINTKQNILETAGALMFLYGFAIGDWIASFTRLPFAVINDGKAAALCEWWIGNLKGSTNAAALTLGTGVGGGLILNNQLYQGSTFQSGELSFILIPQANQQISFFGQQGSAVRFIKQATTLLQLDEEDYQMVFDTLAQKQPSEVYDLFVTYCRNIAVQLINLQVTLNIEKVAIGGGISAQNQLIQTIQAEYTRLFMENELLSKTFEPLLIKACLFRNSANLLGAVYHLFEKSVSL